MIFQGRGVGLDPLSPSGSAHDKLSVYKCTNSVRSTIKLKAVLPEILNVKFESHMLIWMSDSLLLYIEKSNDELSPPIIHLLLNTSIIW